MTNDDCLTQETDPHAYDVACPDCKAPLELCTCESEEDDEPVAFCLMCNTIETFWADRGHSPYCGAECGLLAEMERD